MIIDVSLYRINIPAIVAWRGGRPDEPLLESIGQIAVAYGIPIIAVAHYLGGLEGYTDDLYAFIARLVYYYKVTEVKGL